MKYVLLSESIYSFGGTRGRLKWRGVELGGGAMRASCLPVLLYTVKCDILFRREYG